MTLRAAIVLNPAAGHGRAGRLWPKVERMLNDATAASGSAGSLNWQIHETTGPGQATSIAARCAAEGADIVAAAGGDGTLSEVLNGLLGSRARLALLPMGTGNDFARTVNLHGRLQLAVETLYRGRPAPIDVGRVRGRYFLNVAGCGFDAVVADRANHGPLLLTGVWAYLAALAQTLPCFRAAEFSIVIDGVERIQRAMMCSVANAQTYGGGMRIAPSARLDDGLFDVCILVEAGTLEFLLAFPRVFRGTHITHPKVTMLQARSIRITTSPPLPILVDGEVIGTTPAEFSIIPAAIEFQFPAIP